MFLSILPITVPTGGSGYGSMGKILFKSLRRGHISLSGCSGAHYRTQGFGRAAAAANVLELRIEWRGDVLFVEVEGRLAAATVGRFAREIDAAMEDRTRTVRAVILNCEKLDYVSGIGWHRVLVLGRALAGCDARLLLTALSPSLRIIFGNVDYLGLLSIHETMAEALESLS